MASSCPLCLTDVVTPPIFNIHRPAFRDFFECSLCKLIFVNRKQVLNLNQQKEIYDFHQNHIRASGYINFLMRLVNPVKERFSLASHGLDFGSGPYPMLRELFIEAGYDRVSYYDPIYHPDRSVFNKQYDFITLCEVVEHMVDPLYEFEQILKLLKKNSILVISTGIKQKDIAFSKWSYIQDQTHITFFSNNTFEYIEIFFNLLLVEKKKDLVIFLKR